MTWPRLQSLPAWQQNIKHFQYGGQKKGHANQTINISYQVVLGAWLSSLENKHKETQRKAELGITISN